MSYASLSGVRPTHSACERSEQLSCAVLLQTVRKIKKGGACLHATTFFYLTNVRIWARLVGRICERLRSNRVYASGVRPTHSACERSECVWADWSILLLGVHSSIVYFENIAYYGRWRVFFLHAPIFLVRSGFALKLWAHRKKLDYIAHFPALRSILKRNRGRIGNFWLIPPIHIFVLPYILAFLFWLLWLPM